MEKRHGRTKTLVGIQGHLDRLIGSLWGVAAALDILSEGLTQADVLTVVLALTGIGSVVFRKTARARIG